MHDVSNIWRVPLMMQEQVGHAALIMGCTAIFHGWLNMCRTH